LMGMTTRRVLVSVMGAHPREHCPNRLVSWVCHDTQLFAHRSPQTYRNWQGLELQKCLFYRDFRVFAPYGTASGRGATGGRVGTLHCA
jgi:hypothetical protein